MSSRRDQILASAAELFAARGFHGVSVNDVGAACGISGPALYRHFASKEAMLAEMLVEISERLLDEAQRRTKAASAASGAGERGLHDLLSWHIDFALAHQPLIVVQDRDWSALSAVARQQVRDLQTSYIGLWVEQLRAVRPELDRRQARARVQAVFGLLNSTPRSARVPQPQMRGMLTSMALAALRSE
jgi:AcrR family transcriptional regulator